MEKLEQKIVLLGAGGMLGSALKQEFADYDLHAFDRQGLDITNYKLVKEKLAELKPAIVINAAAYTAVDQAETEKELANKINGEAVENLAKVCAELGCVLVHYSTDYVFSGVYPDGNKEDEVPQPVSHYGWSKLIGEQAIRNNCKKYYLIRTSWLYGPNGKNFVDTISRLAKERDQLKVVSDQHGKPTYTVDLAQATRKLIQGQKEFGIYHLTNDTQAEGITWHDFAKAIVELQNVSVQVNPCTTEEYPLPANRPQYGMLINTRTEQLRNWWEALQEYLS